MEKENRQRILVTGGGGFLGKAIVRKLIQRGENVTTFSRNRYPELDSLGVTQVQGDLADPDDTLKAVRGMDLVFHTAAKAGVWGSHDSYHRPNVTGTRNLLAACKQQGVPRLIHTSSPSVVFDGRDMEGVDESVPYPEKFHTPYTETKAMAEREVLAAARDGLRVIVLRPHLIWGPEDPHIVPRILERADKLVRVGKRENLVDTIYIDNAADAHLLAADKLRENPALSGNIYFISNDEPIPLWDIINGILKAGGREPVTRTLPHGVVRTIGAVLEGIYRLFRIDAEPKMTRFVADELATAHWFDISAVKRDLGYAPGVSIKEGLIRLEEWLQQTGRKHSR
ncbi:MAG: NAD-dependent epimerase/dehydratase family protein [Thermodesulfobacteriota bacterium]